MSDLPVSIYFYYMNSDKLLLSRRSRPAGTDKTENCRSYTISYVCNVAEQYLKRELLYVLQYLTIGLQTPNLG